MPVSSKKECLAIGYSCGTMLCFIFNKWIGHILHRSCLLKHVIEGKMEMTVRRGRRSKQLLDDLKETRGYCKLKDKVLDRIPWRTRFGRGYEPVLTQTKK